MPTQIPQFDPFPQRQSDGAQFAPNVDAYFRQQNDTFIPAANALVTEVNAAAEAIAGDVVSAENAESGAQAAEASAANSASAAANSASEAASSLEACLAASNFQGVYNAGTAYTLGQTVLYSGALWIALQSTTGNEPVSGSAYWSSIYVLTEKVDLPLPTLSLNAAIGEYLSKTGLEAPGKYTTPDDFTNIVSFTRSTPARYPSGESQLAEQNLIRRSQEFDLNGSWINNGATNNADQAVAPDGTTTADEVIETADNSLHADYSNGSNNTFPTTSGETYTGSMFLKKGDGASAPDWIQLNFAQVVSGNTEYVNFDIANGVVGTASGATGSITDYGNGWFRCAITVVASVTGSNGRFGMHLTNNNDALGRNPTYAGSTDANVFVWGAQVEQRDYASDYTPTTDQPITRYQPNVYKTAAIDEPRFAHNLDGTVRGLMVEQSRTNLLTWSNDFSNGFWAKSGVSVIQNSPSPFDGGTAFKVIPNAGSPLNELRANVSVVAGTTYVINIVVSAAEYPQVLVSFGAAGGTFSSESAVFDLTSGVATSGGIESLGGGFYSCSLSAVASSTGTALIRFATPYSNDTNVIGDGYSGIYIAHAGLYEGSKPLAPIVTEGSTVTQGVEVAQVTLSQPPFSDASEVSAFADFEFPNKNKSFGRVFGFQTAVTPVVESLALFDSTSAGVPIRVFAKDINGDLSYAATSVQGASTPKQRVGVRVARESLYIVNDAGGEATVVPTGGAMAPPAVLNIGSERGVSNFLNGYIKDLKIFPVALTDEQLKALTA